MRRRGRQARDRVRSGWRTTNRRSPSSERWSRSAPAWPAPVQVRRAPLTPQAARSRVVTSLAETRSRRMPRIREIELVPANAIGTRPQPWCAAEKAAHQPVEQGVHADAELVDDPRPVAALGVDCLDATDR